MNFIFNKDETLPNKFGYREEFFSTKENLSYSNQKYVKHSKMISIQVPRQKGNSLLQYNRNIQIKTYYTYFAKEYYVPPSMLVFAFQ